MKKRITGSVSRFVKSVLVLALAIAAVLMFQVGIAQARKVQPDPLSVVQGEPRVQVAILLDTSNSMDGLIAQAKSQLWKVVLEMSEWRKDGRRPRVEVALYEYGKQSLPASEGFLRQVVPLTTDLDAVSEALFGLTTYGGEEFCGQVIQAAVESLEWSASPDDLKMIFIAGNEPFTQGRVSFRSAIEAAAVRGIVVNTVHCGSHDEGVRGRWAEGASLGRGQYAAIDSNARVAHVAAPQDDEIARLGQELNRTYVAYGAGSAKRKARQEEQDMNAGSAGLGSVVSRTAVKASAAYSNEDWDLVDAVSKGQVEATAVPAAELPAEMRDMDGAGREKYVREMADKRAGIQKKIRTLTAQREKHVQKQQKDAGSPDTLDTAVLKAVRDQADSKGFKK
jgi:hypothetical protein